MVIHFIFGSLLSKRFGYLHEFAATYMELMSCNGLVALLELVMGSFCGNLILLSRNSPIPVTDIRSDLKLKFLEQIIPTAMLPLPGTPSHLQMTVLIQRCMTEVISPFMGNVQGGRGSGRVGVNDHDSGNGLSGDRRNDHGGKSDTFRDSFSLDIPPNKYGEFPIGSEVPMSKFEVNSNGKPRPYCVRHGLLGLQSQPLACSFTDPCRQRFAHDRMLTASEL